jgi:hypothetical protein
VDAQKSEVIFLYLEAASVNPRDVHHGRAPVEPPPPPAPHPRPSVNFLKRASAAFQVSEP